MNRFTIRDIENLTGIKAHTLRIWEQRYGYDLSKRKEGGHRYFDDDDLKNMLRLSILYNKGNRISSLLELEPDQLTSFCHPDLFAAPLEEPVLQLMHAVDVFDQTSFNQTFHMLVLRHGLEKTMLDTIFPLLQLIGKKWLADRIIPAQEHFCSELIMKKLLVAIDGLEPVTQPSSRTILLFTPPEEFHEIPLLFMRYLLKKNGHRCVYVGKNASIEQLGTMAEKHSPTHLYFHFITHLFEMPVTCYLNALVEAFPGTRIVAAGPALQGHQLPSAESFTWLKDKNEMLAFSKK